MNSTDAFRLAHLQAVIFTPDIAAFNKPRFIAGVLRDHSDRYSGDIESLPVPPGDPKLSSVPLVEFTSPDGQWTLKAASGRMDSHWKRPTNAESVDKAKILQQAIVPLLGYLQESTIQVGRIALVINRFAVVDNPPLKLIQRFCVGDVWEAGSPVAPLRNSRAFEIHNLKTYPLIENVEVNSWVRCRTGIVNDQPAVLFGQDINTLAEQSHERAFTAQQIEEFFRAAVLESDNILSLYFPNGIKNAGL